MITVKHEHKLNFPTITVPMMSEDEQDNVSTTKQDKIEGVLVPLMRFNNLTINFSMVNHLELSNDPIPTIYVVIRDHMQFIKNLDTPGIDNTLHLQILPPFDDAYKKIQLSFTIHRSEIDGDLISMWGTYNCPGWEDVQMKTYGFTSTYELFDAVSNELSLGFASNIDGTEDKRFIYNPNHRRVTLLNDEIEFGGQKEHVLDWWIDLWNNVVLMDIYQEYITLRDENDMKIWVEPMFIDSEFESGETPDNAPQQTTALFSNHPAFMSNPMYIAEYKPIMVAPGHTDLNAEVYNMEDLESTSTLIQDGDVHHCTTLQYEYLGEKFGDFDYLTQREARDMFLNKINSQCIEVQTTHPILGLMKGDKVNVWWYDIGSYLTENADNSTIETNIQVPENTVDREHSLTVNKTVSGQYYIIDIRFEYDANGGWLTTFKLSRSADSVQRLNPPDKETFVK